MSDTEENPRNLKSIGWKLTKQKSEESDFLDIRKEYSDFESDFLDIRKEYSDFENDEYENVRSPTPESVISSSDKDEYENVRSPTPDKDEFIDARKEYPNFKFLEESDSDIYTNTDESSYSSSIDEKLRKKMNLIDRQNALYEALKYLQKGYYKKFLEDEYIRILFAPARALIESCGRGDKTNQTEKLWELAWKGKLQFKQINFSVPKSECISCAQTRDLNYAFYEIKPDSLKKLGYMGPACYEIRFQALLELIQASKYVAELLKYKKYKPGTSDFIDYIMGPIIKAKDHILKAFHKMSKYRVRK